MNDPLMIIMKKNENAKTVFTKNEISVSGKQLGGCVLRLKLIPIFAI